MKVYHPTTGVVYEGEPVDCRELRTLHGYTLEPMPNSVAAATLTAEQLATKEKADAEAAAKAAAKNREVAEGMTVAELKTALEAKSVDIPAGSLKADLVELFLKS